MIVLWFFLAGAITALEAWAVMLIVGALHSHVPEIPAINYWGSIWTVLLANVLVGVAVGTAVGVKK
ncbi:MULTISPECIES: hypothetical protein [unclassified Streptomyces]|uniref:hypothetical protein n=1 Tax=unclassified Streptomyces TaxID=2593676 RepID=UPI000B2EB1CF|nr:MULTISPECIES: hypothetical protein [unclassified Streptomyces]